MWVTTVTGFISLVQDREDPEVLQVRARLAEDIQATFPGAQVTLAEGADYRFRARIGRREVADRLHAAVMAIDYDSHFKDVALAESPANPERHNAYYDTWAAMAQMQDYAPYSLTPRPVRQRWEDEDDYPDDDYRQEDGGRNL